MNSELSERLETRKIVERAKGILQRDLGIGEEEAYLTIQRQSRQRRRSKREIAEAILLVFLVMLLFLQNIRATFIPTIAAG